MTRGLVSFGMTSLIWKIFSFWLVLYRNRNRSQLSGKSEPDSGSNTHGPIAPTSATEKREAAFDGTPVSRIGAAKSLCVVGDGQAKTVPASPSPVGLEALCASGLTFPRPPLPMGVEAPELLPYTVPPDPLEDELPELLEAVLPLLGGNPRASEREAHPYSSKSVAAATP